MNLELSPLFAPLMVKGKTFRNRIVMPPIVVNRGHTSKEALDWYGRHAGGGASMVIVEATNNVLFEGDLDGGRLRPLADAIKSGGALAAIQIFPGIRGQGTAPADMSPSDMGRLKDNFRRAAVACAEAGFDGIEPHGAHGFLLNQFLSPIKNGRKDGYGGPLEGRMRLALEIMDLILPIAREAGMLLMFRHSPERQGFGISPEDNIAFVKALVAAGLDILDISPASDKSPADLAAPFMGLGVPVIAVNEMDEPERALEALRETRADLLAIGRALIADPDLPRKLKEGRQGEISKCIRCDGCYGLLRKGVPVECVQRP